MSMKIFHGVRYKVYYVPESSSVRINYKRDLERKTRFSLTSRKFNGRGSSLWTIHMLAKLCLYGDSKILLLMQLAVCYYVFDLYMKDK